MYYVEVAVDHKTVRGTNTLTYASEAKLSIGDIVRVPIRKSLANGVVLSTIKEPSYPTKEVSALLYSPGIPRQLIKTALWMSEYYGVDLSQVMQTLLPRGLNKKRRDITAKAKPKLIRDQSHKLTKEQSAALETISKHSPNTVLLHGVTGSGKTRIYIERLKLVQAEGLGAIVLVPEIGLTSQMVSDIESQFSKVFVLHSQQTENSRHKLWEEILGAEAPIVIGPRSALFAPITKLGLIVIDEEHEQTYKQDQAPKYHALRVASKLAHASKAQLILGSATPRIEDFYLAQERKSPIVSLKQAVNEGVNKTTIEVVDLKNRDNFTKQNSILSDQLLSAIETALLNEQQALIFLNRRGTSTSLICSNCGWHAECPNCYLPLTHHSDWQKLICHVCNYQQRVMLSCPECNMPKLIYKGIGTKQIVTELKKIYPNKIIARFDADTKKGEQLADRYAEIHDGNVDIIVGTQVIAKGLDFPKVSCVGVVLADSSLYLPDFSANERTFQLLSQVIGRTGRHTHGTVVIQTYSPDHPAIQTAANREYETFYEREIDERKQSHYPPFVFLLKLTCERVQLATVQKTTQGFAQKLRQLYPEIEVLGPSPALHERTNSGYRWQLVVKTKNRGVLLEIIDKHLPANWQHDLDPSTLL